MHCGKQSEYLLKVRIYFVFVYSQIKMTFGSGLKYGYKDQRMEGTYRFSASQMGKLPLREVKWFSQVRMGINSRNWGSVFHTTFSSGQLETLGRG